MADNLIEPIVSAGLVARVWRCQMCPKIRFSAYEFTPYGIGSMASGAPVTASAQPAFCDLCGDGTI